MGALERLNSPAKVQRIGNDSVYGTGSDGTVVIASNTSLTRDMYYDNLTINSGSHLNTNGFKVFVKNTLTINGSIGVTSGASISSATIAGTTSGASVTDSIGGSAFGATYTASQLPTAIANDISTAILGYYIDTNSVVRPIKGGAGGANGVAGTVTPGAAGTVTPGQPGAVTPGAVGGASAGYMAAPTTWHGKDNTYGYHVTSSGPGGNHSVGLYGQGQGYPGGPGNQGTSGTNGAAGTTPAARLGGTISAAVAGSTPPAASAGVAGIGGPIVILVAKTFTGTGSIVSQGSNSTAGGPSATGTGAGVSATSTNAQSISTGYGATSGAAGSAGAYTPSLSLHHGVNNNVHWNRTVAPAHHVSQPAGALGRTGPQVAKADNTAHGHDSHTTHGATPTHPHNSHGGSNPHTGAASISYSAVPAVSGYFHKNSVDHTAGGHLGHAGAVAHPYTYNSAGNHGAHGFADNHYHEHDANPPTYYPEYNDYGATPIHVAAYHAPTPASARTRYDARHHHTQGVYAQAGTDAHHTEGVFVSGLGGPGGQAGSPGANGTAYAGYNAHTTAGTNGSTTAGTAGQSGGGGGIIIVTDTALPVGITKSAAGGVLSGNTANSGSIITILNA
jgi:hypothetical protein